MTRCSPCLQDRSLHSTYLWTFLRFLHFQAPTETNNRAWAWIFNVYWLANSLLQCRILNPCKLTLGPKVFGEIPGSSQVFAPPANGFFCPAIPPAPLLPPEASLELLVQAIGRLMIAVDRKRMKVLAPPAQKDFTVTCIWLLICSRFSNQQLLFSFMVICIQDIGPHEAHFSSLFSALCLVWVLVEAHLPFGKF